MNCYFNPPEAEPCDQPATHAVTFRLRQTGWYRTHAYCHHHALAAEPQAGTTADPLGPDTTVGAYYTPPGESQ